MREFHFSILIGDNDEVYGVTMDATNEDAESVEFSVNDLATALELMYDQASDHISSAYNKEEGDSCKVLAITC
jgi:hypothetical protein